MLPVRFRLIAPTASVRVRCLRSFQIASSLRQHDGQLSQKHSAIGSKGGSGAVEEGHVRDGQRASQSQHQNDVASPASQSKAQNDLSGNKEGLGFAEQVGGASDSASSSRPTGTANGEEESQAPGLFSSIKQGLGLSTDSGDVKQNQGGGRGVTGTGTARRFSTSAATFQTHSAPDAASKSSLKDKTNAEQSDHLKHKAVHERDAGGGNAAPNPELPSQRNSQSNSTAKVSGQQKRPFSTSVARRVAKPSADPEQQSSHTNDTNASGSFHQAGPGDAEYKNVSGSGAPYDKSDQMADDDKMRYGGKPEWREDKGKQGGQSGPHEGPAGEAAGGRKPEGQ